MNRILNYSEQLDLFAYFLNENADYALNMTFSLWRKCLEEKLDPILTLKKNCKYFDPVKNNCVSCSKFRCFCCKNCRIYGRIQSCKATKYVAWFLDIINWLSMV